MAANTATPSALEQATALDAANLFLAWLADLPAFVEKREGLEELAGFVRDACEERIANHKLDESAIDVASYKWLESRGLVDECVGFIIDPGSGRDVQLLTEKVHALASEVIGVKWNDRERKWER